MRNISSSMLEKLSHEATQFCYCWKIERLDGQRLGFTTHDQDITFDGLTFTATSSLNNPMMDMRLGMNVDSFEAMGVIDSDYITEADLRAGRYQDANITLYFVDFAAPDDHISLMSGRVSSVSEGRKGFQIELRQATDQLADKKGRQYSAMCDAYLGERRCGVDLSLSDYNTVGIIDQQRDSLTLIIRDLPDFEEGWFSFGTLTFLSGHFEGQSYSIAGHRNIAEGALCRLWLPLPWPAEIGAQVRLKAGCDKSLTTCASKFNNHLNFQGFPLIPGVAYATS